jgi:hypothetical protein
MSVGFQRTARRYIPELLLLYHTECRGMEVTGKSCTLSVTHDRLSFTNLQDLLFQPCRLWKASVPLHSASRSPRFGTNRLEYLYLLTAFPLHSPSTRCMPANWIMSTHIPWRIGMERAFTSLYCFRLTRNVIRVSVYLSALQYHTRGERLLRTLNINIKFGVKWVAMIPKQHEQNALGISVSRSWRQELTLPTQGIPSGWTLIWIFLYLFCCPGVRIAQSV